MAAPEKTPRQSAPKKPAAVKQFLFAWEGKNRDGKAVSGDMEAPSETVVSATLRRQGVTVSKIKKRKMSGGSKVTDKDITLFTRQIATMMRAGVPLLQSFDIVARGHSNPSVTKLLLGIKTDIESGTSLSNAFRKHPLYFDALFCNLVAAGEQAGILDSLLDRLATYKEKMQALKGKIKSALTYPISVIGICIGLTAVIMIKVVPAFKEVFSSFGADLPGPTLVVMAISDFFVEWWWLIFGILGGGIYALMHALKTSENVQRAFDRYLLELPIFGPIIRKAVIARWVRTLATMFAAGVPLVEALESVGGASGNYLYKEATKTIQRDVSSGSTLTSAMISTNLFPTMVTQMSAIGEESGSLDSMLSKVADFFEREVDDAVDSLSSLMEPLIMVILGTLIGSVIVAMYLPLFKLGSVV
jgi:type IV pilus assembly protein PilC